MLYAHPNVSLFVFGCSAATCPSPAPPPMLYGLGAQLYGSGSAFQPLLFPLCFTVSLDMWASLECADSSLRVSTTGAGPAAAPPVVAECMLCRDHKFFATASYQTHAGGGGYRVSIPFFLA